MNLALVVCISHFAFGFIPPPMIQICHDGWYFTSFSPYTMSPEYSAALLHHKNDIRVEKKFDLPMNDTFDPHLYTRDLHVQDIEETQAELGNEWVSIPLLGDYKGHWTRETENRTFYYSDRNKNATTGWWSPYAMSDRVWMHRDLFRDQWYMVDQMILEWLESRQHPLYVIAGSEHENREEMIPNYIWKAVCDPVARKSVAFLYENVREHTAMMLSVGELEDFLEKRIMSDECRTTELDTRFWM